MTRPWGTAAVAFAIGCSDAPARLTLAPIEHGSCGRPPNATGIRVIAYGAGGEVTRAVALDETLAIDDFPADTEQLGVEVTIGGGEVGAAGKSAPFVFGDLPTGTTIPVFMAPPGGFCATAQQMHEVRVAPLLARAGDGVLVLGGHDGAGRWSTTAEYYDPATSTFTLLDVPEVLGANGFAGTHVTTLPNGDVAISGGPQPVITRFLAESRTFSESVLISARAFHTSIPTGDRELLLAGGCQDVANGACSGLVRNSSLVYDVEALGADPEDGPVLRARRIGASVFDIGIQADGRRAYVLAGGTAPMGTDPLAADRIVPASLSTVELAGTHPHAAALDGGAVLTARMDAASVIAPGVATARSITRPPDLLDGVRLIGLEDGRVLGVGGAASDELALYDPTSDRWQLAAPRGDTPGALPGASMLRLADGSVLGVGGATPSAQAWIYRPSLLGPASGDVTVVPGANTTNVLTAADPATVSRAQGWQLTALDGLARAFVGGPRLATGSLRATVRVREGGVALIAQDLGPGRALVAEVSPGQPSRLVRHAGGESRTLCTGKQVPALSADLASTVRLEVGGTVRLALDDGELLACDLDAEERGAWGVGALGTGARVAVETVTLAR